MKTAEEIIDILALELAEAYELHDAAKGKDAQEALFYMIKATIITHILVLSQQDLSMHLNA